MKYILIFLASMFCFENMHGGFVVPAVYCIISSGYCTYIGYTIKKRNYVLRTENLKRIMEDSSTSKQERKRAQDLLEHMQKNTSKWFK